MDSLRSIFSSFRLPTLPRFSMNPPCEITIEFFYLCGHTVTSRRCRNNQRIWRDDTYSHPATACDESCPTRTLPYVIHMHLHCTWCRYTGGDPRTSSVRSDPGVDVIPPMELQRRRDFYLLSRQAQITEAQRAEIYRGRSKEESWESRKRLEHEWADGLGKGWAERLYFVGGPSDLRLYMPIDRGSFPESEDAQCAICHASLWEGEPPIRLPCHVAHRYHTDCINEWLPENETCPACRHRYCLTKYHQWEQEHDSRLYSRFLSNAATIPSSDWPDAVEQAERDAQAEWDWEWHEQVNW